MSTGNREIFEHTETTRPVLHEPLHVHIQTPARSLPGGQLAQAPTPAHTATLPAGQSGLCGRVQATG